MWLRGARRGQVVCARANFFARALLFIHAEVRRCRRELSRLFVLPGVVLFLRAQLHSAATATQTHNLRPARPICVHQGRLDGIEQRHLLEHCVPQCAHLAASVCNGR
jgi:hypothetical protein